ncbi:MAG: NAD(P)H-binding protein [Acaryochloridaceae cyanobacterium RU_4_10]|nr:NAD(P)H-binding protein [Acaryochloridaceae cyanobacterium RU_4_10]
MTGQFLIYGATGYTGKLMARMAKKQGLHPVLSGRNAKTLKAVAEPLGFEYKVVDLAEKTLLDRTLTDMTCVLHAAGPFSTTARPMLEACIRAGVHYLDITGEIDVFEACAARDRDAQKRGIMVMPGVGFDVVPSDCMAAYVRERLPDATQLTLAIGGLNSTSRGTAKTAIEWIGRGTRARRNSKIVSLEDTPMREIDFGDGPKRSIAVSWGDVSTAYYTTGIPDITVFFEASPKIESLTNLSGFMKWLLALEPAQALLKTFIDLQPEGPTDAERQSGSACIYAEAENDRGDRISALLSTPEGYTLTCMTGLEIVRRVLDGQAISGFQTPANVFGPDFILGFEGCTRTDIPSQSL